MKYMLGDTITMTSSLLIVGSADARTGYPLNTGMNFTILGFYNTANKYLIRDNSNNTRLKINQRLLEVNSKLTKIVKPPLKKKQEIEQGDTIEFHASILNLRTPVISSHGHRNSFTQGERFSVLSILPTIDGDTYTLVATNCEAGGQAEIVQITSETMSLTKIVKKIEKQIKLNLAPELESFLLKSLNEAAQKNTFVEITPQHRNIGKTTAVVKYAECRNATAVVSNYTDIESLKKETGYDNIVKVVDVPRLAGGNFIYDECIDISKLSKALQGREHHFNFITGFVAKRQ